MAFPLIRLSLNLLWPRTRICKFAALVILIAAAWHYGWGGLNHMHRSLGVVEESLAKGEVFEPVHLIGTLRLARATADQTVFDLCVGLTLGIIFAFTPPDIVTSVFPRFRAALPSTYRVNPDDDREIDG